MARGFGTLFGAGATDQIQTKSIPALADKVSICIWYYLFGTGGSSLGRYISRTGFDLMYDDGGSTSLFLRGNSGGTTTAHVTWPTTKDNIWRCLVLTHDQSGGVASPTVWRDGVLQTLTTVAGTAGADTAAVLNLGNSAAGTRNFDGMLAYFTLWQGVLLTASDAQSLAAGTYPLLIQPESITSCIPMDGVNKPEPDLAPGMGFTSSITGTRLPFRQAPVYQPVSPWLLFNGVPTAPTGITLRRTLGQRIGSRAA